MNREQINNLIDTCQQEIRRLQEKNQQLKEQLQQKEDIINKIKKYLRENEKEYGSLEENEKIILQILDNKGE